MTGYERVVLFEEKVKKITAWENFRVGLVPVLYYPVFVLCFIFMMVRIPYVGMVRFFSDFAEGFWFPFVITGLLLMVGEQLYSRWRFVLSDNGEETAWTDYLKYIPVDWEAYCRRLREGLVRYTLTMAGIFFAAQLLSQLLSGALQKYGFSWALIAYPAGMCIIWVLLPGLLRIRRIS